MQMFLQDLRFALRMFVKQPGFMVVALLTLALGIGANTALFSLADAILFRKLPVAEPERLVLFDWQAGKEFRRNGMRGTFVGGYPPGMQGGSSFPGAFYEKFRRERNPDGPLADVFAFTNLRGLNIVVDGQADVTNGQIVSGNYFSGIGVAPALGRLITDADDATTAAPVAVISHAFWKERFNGDPAVIGKTVSLNQVSFTIVGVTQASFTGSLQVGDRPAVSVPLAFEPQLNRDFPMIDRPGQPGPWWIQIMGRMKPGATREQVFAAMDGQFQRLALERMPAPRREGEKTEIAASAYPHLRVLPGQYGQWEMRYRYSTSIYFLLGIGGLTLLIACANVANMLLSRGVTRRHEITVRLAVGAGRSRLIRQLLTESLLLSILSGGAGILFAVWGCRALVAMSSDGSMLPANLDYRLDWRVLGFTLAVSLLTGLLFGVAPAWRSTRLDLNSGLKANGRQGSSISNSLLSKTLVVLQVAMSLILLIGAGLFIRTLRNLESTDLGFNQEKLLLFSLRPAANGYKEEKLLGFYQQTFERLDALPGVKGATFGSVPLVAHYYNNTSLLLPGEKADSKAEHETSIQIIRENYFGTMEIPLVRGRGFTEQDGPKSQRVAVVNETFVKTYFPNTDPLGQRVGFDADSLGKIEIVGVVRDAKYNAQREKKEPLLYSPWRQEVGQLGEMSFAVRATGDPLALVASVRQTVRDVDQNLPVVDIKTQVQQSEETLTEERAYARLLGFFGGLALLLASIGLYGVIAFSVAQRTGEIGIRMALGAQMSDVVRLVTWQGMKLVLIGAVLGVAGAFALKRFVESQLYGLTATDPGTFATVVGILLVVALAACLIPARRASQVDPMEALRSE